jgi:hypothetical protein
MRRAPLLLALGLDLAAAFALASAGRAQSGLHATIAGEQLLISRAVGAEQWAITEHADGVLTGNVFFVDGTPPAFIECQPTSVVESPDPALATYTYDCFGTETCTPDACPEWVFLSSVTLTGAFFEPPPPGPSPTATQPTPTPSAAPSATPAPTGTATPRPTPTSTTAPTPPPATPTPKPSPTPRPSPTPSQTPKPPALVITPDRGTVEVGDSFVFVITGGVPPYSLNVTIGGTVQPTQVAAPGSPFTFTATQAGASSVIVVDAATTVKTVAITVKESEE